MPDMHAEHAVLQQYHGFTLAWHTSLLHDVALVTASQAKSSVSLRKAITLAQAVSIIVLK